MEASMVSFGIIQFQLLLFVLTKRRQQQQAHHHSGYVKYSSDNAGNNAGILLAP